MTCGFRWPTRTGRLPASAILGVIGLACIAPACALALGLAPGRLLRSLAHAPDVLSSITLSLDWNEIPELAAALWQTLEIGLLATGIAVVASFPLAFLGARNASPHPLVFHLTRLLLSMVRALPEIVWALVFVSALGLGALPGVMAVAVVSLGFLGKFLAESLEVVQPGPVEGVAAHGADWLQVRLFGMLPQAIPDYIGTVLYMLDHNLRSAAILGVVGAGGIGYAMVMSLRLCEYGKLLAICVGVWAVVTVIDRCSEWLRRRVI